MQVVRVFHPGPGYIGNGLGDEGELWHYVEETKGRPTPGWVAFKPYEEPIELEPVPAMLPIEPLVAVEPDAKIVPPLPSVAPSEIVPAPAVIPVDEKFAPYRPEMEKKPGAGLAVAAVLGTAFILPLLVWLASREKEEEK